MIWKCPQSYQECSCMSSTQVILFSTISGHSHDGPSYIWSAVFRMQLKQHRSCKSAMLCWACHQHCWKAWTLVTYRLLPCCHPTAVLATVTQVRHPSETATTKLHIDPSLFQNGYTWSCHPASWMLSNSCHRRGRDACCSLPQ